jgi:hypothetical protein
MRKSHLQYLVSALICNVVMASGWLPLQDAGVLVATSMRWPAGNLSSLVVVDTASSDTVLLVREGVLQNISQLTNTTSILRRGVSHSLLVDGGAVVWPGSSPAEGSETALVSISISVLMEASNAGAHNRSMLPSVSVLLSPSARFRELPSALGAAWASCQSVWGLMSAAHSGSGNPLDAFKTQGSNTSFPFGVRYLSLHLWERCLPPSSAPVGLAPTCRAAPAPPNGIGAMGLSDSLDGALTAMRNDLAAFPGMHLALHWSQPAAVAPSAAAAPPFSSTLFHASLCGRRLLPTTHAMEAIIDTGAACLTLPAEAFAALRVHMRSVLHCPTPGDGLLWPAWAVDNNGAATQCRLKPNTSIQHLPWLSWSLRGAAAAGKAGPLLQVPIASLLASGQDEQGGGWARGSKETTTPTPVLGYVSAGVAHWQALCPLAHLLCLAACCCALSVW